MVERYAVIPVAGEAEAGGPTRVQGLDMVVKDISAAAKSLSSAANDLMIIASRNQTMQGSSPVTSATGSIEREVTRAAKAAIREEAAALIKIADPEPPPPGRKPSLAGTEPQDREDSDAPEAPRRRGNNVPMSDGDSYGAFTSARDFLRDPRVKGGSPKFSLSNARAALGRNIMERNIQWGDQYTQDFLGPNNEMEIWRDSDGLIASVGSDTRIIQDFLRREKMVGAVREFGRGLTQGRSFAQAGAGALPMGLAKGAGVIGAGIFAANQIADFMESQRAANAEWQSFMGGTQGDAFAARAGQKVFGMSQFGFMDSKQAEQLYRSVSELGLQGGERQDALDFALNSYRRFGMGIAESTKLIEQASKLGQGSLKEISESLETVTEAAANAGVNAQKARAAFTQAWGQTAGQIGAGAASAQIASAMTAAEVGLGPEFEGASFNFMDERNLVITASRLGMNPNEFRAMGYENPDQFTEHMVGNKMEMALNVAFATPQARAQAQEMIGQGLSTEEIVAAINGMGAQGFAGLNMMSVLNSFGISSTSDHQAKSLIIEALRGNVDPVRVQQEQREAQQTQSMGLSLGQSAAEMGSEKFLQDTQARADLRADLMAGVNRGGLFGIGADAEGIRQVEAFLSSTEELNRRGGISERLVASGVKMVEVQTASGPRIVSVQEALANPELRNQIDQGNVRIVEGPGAGKTVAEHFAMHGDTSVQADISAVSGDIGVSVEEYQKDVSNRQKRGEEVGTVMIGLTDEARRVLFPTVSGIAYYEEEWTPRDPYVASGSLPSGNG